MQNPISLYLIRCAVSIDQLINTVFAPMLNLLLSDGSYKFGHPDETLSSVMGKNINRGKCRGCHFICKILSKFDDRHCEESIEDV